MKRATCLAALLAVASASAWPLVVDERRDGELPWPGTIGARTWLLDPGANTVLGSLTWSHNPGVADDFDAFTFAVPAGFAVRSVNLSVHISGGQSGIDPPDSFDVIDWHLSNASFASITHIHLPTNYSGPLFSDAMPLLSNAYEIATLGFGGSLTLLAFYRADYRLQVDVVSCPRPNSLSTRVRAAFGA
jgi:hypothetical protein